MSLRVANALRLISQRSFSVNACLASKGTGAGGAIREGGGAFSERETALENAYFKKLESEQFAKLKKRHDEEIEHHEKEIQRHLDAIKRHREHQSELKSEEKK